MLKFLKNIPPSSLKLNLIVVCETVLLLTVALGVMLYFSHQALRQEAIHDAEETLDGTVQHIDNILLSIVQTTENIYQDVQNNLDQPERMETYSRQVVECNPYITGCAIVFKPYFYKNQELFMAYIHREESILVKSDSFGPKPYTEQIWYTKPMESENACWTDPFKDENMEGGALTTFCLPIFLPSKDNRKKECVGVMAVDLSISQLSKIVLEAKLSPNSYSVLLGSNGAYMIHPDTQKLSLKTVFTVVKKESSPTVKEAANAMMAGETGYKPFTMNGKDWYVFYKPFSSEQLAGHNIAPLKWSVGEVCPDDDIFGSFYLLLYTVVSLAILGLVIFFLLCHAFIHKQLQPLRMLTNSAKHIAEGNYNEPVPYTDREDEIGQLQYRFRKMQQSLAMHVSELKQLNESLKSRGEILEKSSEQSIENDRMRSKFLHYISNQMISPGDLIDKSVTKLCNNYHEMSIEDIEKETEIIKQQSTTILQLLGHIIQAMQIDSGKEDSHE